MFTKVLIANRGEVAARIARTCRDLGIATVGVFSDPDERALHVGACDEAVRLGGATPAETYLRGDLLVEVARRTGAQAVHPGFGFLSEDPAFARLVVEAGLTWVGPPAEVIAAMGDKLTAKRAIAEAGIPHIPSEELDGSVAAGVAGEEVGYPLMVKAAAGGGGKGMRVVREADELQAAVEAAGREAAGAFGDDRLFLERLVTRPRHVEVQVLADAHGGVVHLLERECSIQRRHQKVVEEAPSPGIDAEVREAMCGAAVAAARAIGYVSAGTVEFVVDELALERRRAGESLDPARTFAFLEVNTRLQVEHPVTEETVRVRGAAGLEPVDLVRLQLLVAAGRSLPFAQEQVVRTGHAIEARVYAEDPARDHLPTGGRLHAVEWPELPGLRYDSGVSSGEVVSPHYDPMLAKVIAAAPTRPEAAARLARALERSVLHGVVTNRDLLVAVLRDPAFLAGDTTTAFLEERFPDPGASLQVPQSQDADLAAIVVAIGAVERGAAAAGASPSQPVGFSTTGGGSTVALEVAGTDREVWCRQRRDGDYDVVLDGRRRRVRTSRRDGGVDVEVDGHRHGLRVVADGAHHQVLGPGVRVEVVEVPRFPEVVAARVAGATLSPMPGSVVDVAVDQGDEVTTGQVLVTVEAMKMEHPVTAPFDGRVAEVRVSAGEQVEADQVLVVVDDTDPGRRQDGSAASGE